MGVYQVLSGLLLLATTLECGKSDHVHLKIHIPEIKHSHKHTKTKYIHIFHPKVIHSDHSSIKFLHSRRDPNIGSTVINGGYPQPLVNLNEHQPELRITEEEFKKWRQEQVRKALDERKRVQDDERDSNNADSDDDRDSDDDNYDPKDDDTDEKYTEDLYKKHKANKANSAGRKEPVKHRNHNYNQDFEASNSDKHYTNYSTRTSNRRKPPQTEYYHRSRKNTQRPHGYVAQPNAQASNIQLQYQNVDPTVLDPTFYSTIPDQATAGSENQDDIYSGLMTRKFDKKIVDKSKLLADINYNRKAQTKLFASRRRDE